MGKDTDFSLLLQYAKNIRNDADDYRLIERMAIEYRLEDAESIDNLSVLYKKTLLHGLILGEFPLPLLADRNALYAVTHTIFYVSLFGSRHCLAETADASSTRLTDILETGMLISCRHNDIDVLLELLCSAFILNVEGNIDSFIVELVLTKLGSSQAIDGRIGPDGWAPKESVFFKDTYHTTLVGCILGSVSYGN